MSNSTNTVELYKMKHYLTGIRDMANSVLADVTDAHIDEYEAEHAKMRDVYRVDVEVVRETKARVRRDIGFLWGDYNKQWKYVDRNLRTELTKVDSHYQIYPDPTSIRRMVSNARDEINKNVGNTAKSGLGQKSMEEIDSAIKFLISQGYSYGTDFSSHNAVDIMSSLAPETFHNSMVSNLANFSRPECCGSWDNDSYQAASKMREKNKMWCECGSEKKTFSFDVVDGELCVNE